MLQTNPSVRCVNISRCDWFNKESDWPITRHDKVWWENQTENDEMKKGSKRSQQKDEE